MTHQWVCTNQPNYIIISCLSAVETREDFCVANRWNVVHLAFFRKRAAFREAVPRGGVEGEITAAGAHSGFFFSFFLWDCFFLSRSLHICLWIWLSDIWTIPTSLLHLSFSPALHSSSFWQILLFPAHIEQPFAVECSYMIRADRSLCCREAVGRSNVWYRSRRGPLRRRIGRHSFCLCAKAIVWIRKNQSMSRCWERLQCRLRECARYYLLLESKSKPTCSHTPPVKDPDLSCDLYIKGLPILCT